MTLDLSQLSASDGTGEAVRGRVTASRSPGATVLTPDSLVKWPATFVATTGPLLSDGTLDPVKALVFRGHISGSTIIIDELAPGYTDTYGSANGDVIIIKPATWWANTLINSIRTSHNDDGTLKPAAVQKANTLSWSAPLSVTPSSVTYNGNRSYDFALPSDLTGTLSPGMRIMTTRTTAAPTQCTSLNGTTQYWSKTSPAGMTFTNNFVVSAWVKLTSYGNTANIISRYNGTSGWRLCVDGGGQVRLTGLNASSANFSEVVSYQSIPLNKWIHITAQLDMATFTATTTTSYVMIDGVDVPCSVSRGGTNPTALVQAGNLEIGSWNSGLQLFPGKIAQAAVFSAKVTQSTIRTYMSQSLLGTETSLVSAFSLSGATGMNDLNTTSANNLTASGAATTTNADAPFGGQAGGTISSILDYGILQKITSTTATVQAAEGCTFPTNSGGIAAISYGFGVPYNFPRQKEKWAIEVKYKNQLSTTVTSTSAWLNIPGVQVTLPVGEFDSLSTFEGVVTTSITAGYLAMRYTLSNGTTPQAYDYLSASTPVVSATSAQQNGEITIAGPISNSAQTTYYLNAQPGIVSGTTTAYIGGGYAAEFKFYNAYL